MLLDSLKKCPKTEMLYYDACLASRFVSGLIFSTVRKILSTVLLAISIS